MFERQIQLEQQQGVRGPFTRFFSVLSSVEEAHAALRDAATAALCAAAGWVFVTFFVGAPVLIFAAFTAAPAVVLFFRPSRLAAVSLTFVGVAFLLFAAISVGTNAILAWPPVLFGGITLLAGRRARMAMAVIRPNYLEAYHARQAQSDESPQRPEGGNGV